jgi:hypothetical protein
MSYVLETEEQVRNCFGNRGQPFDDESKLTFKVLKDWIFIHDSLDDYDEVEMYATDSISCECFDGWDKKGFDWSNDHLMELIQDAEKTIKRWQEE